MQKFNIDIEYVENEKKERKFEIKDISSENVQLINKIYNLDFLFFNYNKITYE